MRKDAVFLLSP